MLYVNVLAAAEGTHLDVEPVCECTNAASESEAIDTTSVTSVTSTTSTTATTATTASTSVRTALVPAFRHHLQLQALQAPESLETLQTPNSQPSQALGQTDSALDTASSALLATSEDPLMMPSSSIRG